ncbi:hypothetical protein [Streptomyces sp. NPDC049881]|uniref:hypothetical protein n=1 Tax=Streptomyces sp. NPDC049881 TaxID=3155778 RepID=UPI00343ED1DD
MTSPARRPLLFLDVDGPLIPFGAAPARHPAPAGAGNPLLNRLDPHHGPRLAALACEPVWATTWGDDANDCLAPLLGLPPLPVVPWPEPSDLDALDAWNGLHWKTRALVTWAAGRPFAWADDELTAADRAWVTTHHPAPALLHRVDPRHGLTGDDYATLGAWLRQQAPELP